MCVYGFHAGVGTSCTEPAVAWKCRTHWTSFIRFQESNRITVWGALAKKNTKKCGSVPSLSQQTHSISQKMILCAPHPRCTHSENKLKVRNGRGVDKTRSRWRVQPLLFWLDEEEMCLCAVLQRGETSITTGTCPRTIEYNTVSEDSIENYSKLSLWGLLMTE